MSFRVKMQLCSIPSHGVSDLGLGTKQMIKPIQVESRDGYKIWVKFEDGIEGEVDLSGFVARGGLFKKWEDREFFENVWIPEDNVLKWGDSDFHELCGDSLYMKITGMSFDEYSQRVNQNLIHA